MTESNNLESNAATDGRHDVFILYTFKDKVIADALCAKLEEAKIRCWIGPRDVSMVRPYAESVTNAIKSAKCMVAVLTNVPNTPHAPFEIALAVRKRIPIAPFEIARPPLSGTMEYFATSPHWLDIWTPDREQQFTALVASVRRFVPDKASGKTADTYASPESDAASSTEEIENKKFAFQLGASLMQIHLDKAACGALPESQGSPARLINSLLTEWNSLKVYSEEILAQSDLQSARASEPGAVETGSIDTARSLIVELGYLSLMWIQLDRTDREIWLAVLEPLRDLMIRLDRVEPELTTRMMVILQAYSDCRVSSEVASQFSKEILEAMS